MVWIALSNKSRLFQYLKATNISNHLIVIDLKTSYIQPQGDGVGILNFPQLTTERRKRIKQADKLAEHGKVAVRNVDVKNSS